MASTGKGLNEEVIREMSRIKGEPEWMLEFRLKSYETFKKMPMQTWGADLSELDFDDIVYYQNRQISQHAAGMMYQTKIKETFERIGIPEAERAYLAGASAQYESEVVYHNMKEEYDKHGIIFTDTDTALKEHPELFKNTLENSFRRQITNWLPSTQRFGQGHLYLRTKRCQAGYSASNLLPYQQ